MAHRELLAAASSVNENILKYYKLGQESSRLSGASLERIRTESVLRRFLPRTPATILDVGGADGVYAFPLSKAGYEVHLVDPIALHIEQGREKSDSSGVRLASITMGDARALKFPNQFADAVLYFGPLYHLDSASERSAALREAYRTLKPRGIFLAAFISRFASLLDGVRAHYLEDEEFARIVDGDLKNGQHRNPTDNPAYFTNAYFHHPAQAKEEVQEAGFKNVRLLSVEGPFWLVDDIQQQLEKPELSTRILEFIERVEAEEGLIGASGHFLAVAER
jgi:ubiquinone/menaquinone biosynthesis C-methylase UbiE